MKFKYSAFSVWAKWLSVFILGIILSLCILYLWCGSIEINKGFKEGLIKSFGACMALSAVYIVEESRKYITLFDEHIHFNSFRFKKLKLKRSSEFAVRYEDIYSIEAVRIPLIGLWAVKIGAKNLPEKIRLSRNFRKENLMFSEIIKRAKQNNPDAYIDRNLSKYIIND